jgi:phosphoglycerate kinase
MVTIDNYDFSGKRAIIRVDFNVPLNENFEITDDTRMSKAVSTIQKVLNGGGSAIIMSHLGRPKGVANPDFSLKHITPHLSELLNMEVQFSSDCIGSEAEEKAADLKAGEVLVLENLRFHKEETEGNKEFAGKLAKLADVYINDAFGTAHRAHASTAIIADFFDTDSKMFGDIINSELSSLDAVLASPKRPVTAIMGGAKVSSKIPIIKNLLDKVDTLIIGGAMKFTFVKAEGGKIGKSLCEDEYLELALEIKKEAKEKGVNLLLATDVLAADAFAPDANTKEFDIMEVEDGWMGLDTGHKSIELFREAILKSGTILWNGPVGVFEMEAFEKGSRAVAEAIAEATEKGAFSLIGGGDSVACINKFGMADKVSYISTAGGALLEYLEGKELPGIKAIRG